MSFSFGAGVRDSLSNLAASLGIGRDKAVHDAFMVFELGRAQIESMYRGDWLARKVVDIVPFRGFPHIPGSDAVTRYGVQGALGAVGGSLFGSGR